MNNAIITNSTSPELGKYQQLAEKCMKLVKNKLYFKHKALSPAIYRMPINYVDPGIGIFGTDANQIYADPMDVISRYKNSPERLIRSYLHMLFHCIYLHPFQTQLNIDNGVWNIALDICCENAVMRLNPEAIDGDVERQQIIAGIKGKIKMFIPELVYNELMQNQSNYNFFDLTALFHMDDHVWLNPPQSGKGNSNDEDDDDNPYQNPNAQSQQGDGDDDQNQQNQQGDGSGNGEDAQDENQQGGDGNGNNNNKNRNNQNRQNQQNSQGNNNQDKRKEWSDVSRQVAADMSSFNKGDGAGDLMQEIDFLTEDKMEYDEFLRAFSVTEEVMKINEDEFDYMSYVYGLTGLPDSTGQKTIDKQVLLIEPLEYKEDKVIKDFVIAIDTSGSCSGELVKRFLNKTYSILKETESFSSRVNIHIVQCDARIQNDTKITNMEEMEDFMKNMKLYGFGGTDFRPVFEYVDTLIKNKEFDNLCGLIYFTDGYGTYPTMPTPYKTAFAFLEDYDHKAVPPWAMSVYWKDDELVTSED